MTTTTLVVAPEPFFTSRGTPFSVYYRTLVGAELGLKIDLLTYGQGQDVMIEGVRVIRIPDFASLGPIKIGPSYHKLFLDAFIVLWTLALLLRRRYNVVHAHEESVFFLCFLKPLFGFKLIYDMHSSLPEQLQNYRFTRSRLLIGLFEALEATCLKSADAVITICPELARYAVARMPDPKRHFLIENTIFEDVRIAAPPGAVAETRAPVLPEGRPVILYAGTFEVNQGLDILISAFALVHAACPEAFLVLIGGTAAQVQRLRELVDQHGLAGHALIEGRLPANVARACTAKASVLVSPRSHGRNTPLKIYEYLASGIPLVATRVLCHTQVLTDEVCVLVEPEPQAMAAGITRMLADREAAARIAANASALSERVYARTVYKGKMRALLDLLGCTELAGAAAPISHRQP